MNIRYRKMRRSLVVGTVLALTVGVLASGATAANSSSTPKLQKASGAVRGFDGSTIKIASIGQKAVAPTLEWGVRGRIERFNDTNEIPGLKINYVEYADDKADVATTLSETRRLVTEDGIFAIVGDFSSTNASAYLKQQQVPYVGAGLDASYCSNQPSTDLWGFSTNGCQTNPNPSKVADTGRLPYQYTSSKLKKKQPTIAVFSSDTASGISAAKYAEPALAGAGFKVVLAKGLIPGTGSVTDYTPYVQTLLTSDGGKAPDAIDCLLAVECIAIWNQLKATGYTGVYEHFLYSDLLVKPMAGSVLQAYEVPFSENTPAQVQMAADVKAVKPGQSIDTATYVGYSEADMFIAGLKQMAKKGKAFITPANLQKVLSHITWEVKGLGGPVSYPASTVTTSPLCSALLADDGTTWTTALAYSCSSRTFPVK